METEINYKSYNANLEKTSEEKWFLCLCLNQTIKIDLSAENQEYLKDVFNILIKNMLENPFYFLFIKSIEEDAKGLNEVCEKYISILNNDLKGVYNEYINSLKEVTNENIK